MIYRRGSTFWTSELSGHLSSYKKGDVVRYALGGEFIGVVREVDVRINKISVAWGGGSLKQHDPDEILPAYALQQKFASRRGVVSGENPKVALLDTKLVRMPPGAKIIKEDVYHPTYGEDGTLVRLRGNKVVWFSDYGRQRDVPTSWEKKFASKQELVRLFKDAGTPSDLEISGSIVAFNRVGRSILEAHIPLVASNLGKKPGKIVKRVGPAKDGGTFVVSERDTSGPGSQDGFMMFVIDDNGKIIKDWGSHPSARGAEKFYKSRVAAIPLSSQYAAVQDEIASQETDISKLQTRRAMYWGGPDRVYRLTRQEQSEGHGVCPKCKGDMIRENFTKSEKLWMCAECGFKVPTGKLTNQKVHIEIEPDGEIEVTIGGEEARVGSRGKASTLKQDLKMKSGGVHPKGMSVVVEWDESQMSSFVVLNDKRVRVSVSSLHKFFTGFAKPPGMRALEKMLDKAVATSVTGQGRIELDGYDRYGFPAWPMALGYISRGELMEEQRKKREAEK